MKKLFVFLAILTFWTNLYAEKLSIFVASSASKAMSEVKDAFVMANKDADIELVFGASGKHYQLLKEGRGFDLFFSADAKYAEQIAKDGNAISEPKVYALGVVALYSLDRALLEGGVENLAKNANKIKHLSIANPKVAPYGVAATQALEALKISVLFKDKIVLGDNISQPVVHVDSGAVDVGIVAFSLISEVNKPKGKAVLIDAKYFEPLKQSFVVTKYAKGKEMASKFADFVSSDEGKKIIQKYGFNTP